MSFGRGKRVQTQKINMDGQDMEDGGKGRKKKEELATKSTKDSKREVAASVLIRVIRGSFPFAHLVWPTKISIFSVLGPKVIRQ